MNLYNEIALWGMLGILIPIGIHLLSKKKKTEIYFGTLDFLEESDSQSAKSIYLTQILLLFIRVALISLICILISQPFWEAATSKKLAFVEKSLESSDQFDSHISPLLADKELTYFTFDTSLKNLENIEYYPSVWSLVMDLSIYSDSIEVFTYNYNKYFKGSKFPLSDNVNWRMIPNSAPHTMTDTLTKGKISSIIKYKSNEDHFSYNIVAQENMHRINDTISISITSAKKSHENHLDLLKLIDVIKSELPIEISTISKKRPDWKINIDTTINNLYSTNNIAWKTSNSPLIFNKVSSSSYTISGKIDPDGLLHSQIVDKLAIAIIMDYLKIHEKEFTQRVLKARGPTISNSLNKDKYYDDQKLPSYFWILVFILIVAERIFSKMGNPN